VVSPSEEPIVNIGYDDNAAGDLTGVVNKSWSHHRPLGSAAYNDGVVKLTEDF
jgi:hypothetical protein